MGGCGRESVGQKGWVSLFILHVLRTHTGAGAFLLAAVSVACGMVV